MNFDKVTNGQNSSVNNFYLESQRRIILLLGNLTQSLMIKLINL